MKNDFFFYSMFNIKIILIILLNIFCYNKSQNVGENINISRNSPCLEAINSTTDENSLFQKLSKENFIKNLTFEEIDE